MRLFGFSTFVVCAVLAAGCGGSSGTTSGTAGTTGTTGGTGGSTATTGGSGGTGGSTATTGGATTGGTGGTGGATTTGTGGNSCQADCIMNNDAAFKVFQGYELKECGCASKSVCEANCGTECKAVANMMDPMLTQDSPCGMCLLTEAGKGQSSACTTTAGTTCIGDDKCSPFVTCVLACP